MCKLHNYLAGSLELDRTDPGAAITPFLNAHTPNPPTSLDGVAPSPGTTFLPSVSGHRDETKPPMYKLSQTHSLGSGYPASPDNTIARVSVTPAYNEADHGSWQQRATSHREYTGSNDQMDCTPDPHSQYVGVQRHLFTSSSEDSTSHHRDHPEGGQSRTSLACMSGNQLTISPALPPPDTMPGSSPTQGTLQLAGKSIYVLPNNRSTPGPRQHEDSGVRLDSNSEEEEAEQETIDLPPAYRPN